jgi:predicted alpha/beta hydrolase
MCNPTAMAVTSFAVQTISAKAEYDDAKDRYRLQKENNDKARKSSQMAYLSDLGKLDIEQQQKQKEIAIAKEAKETELIKKQSEGYLAGLEKGNANINAVLRDIGYEYQPEFLNQKAAIEDINTQTIFGYSDAYKAMEETAMALKIAGGGMDSYGKYNSGYYGKT